MKALLAVDGVSKRFGSVVANQDIHLAVPAGHIVGLIGPNGSGKTTLFDAIAGTHPVDAGSIRFDGEEITALRTPAIARRGLLRTFQQTQVYAGMSCLENLYISTPQWDTGWLDALRRTTKPTRADAEELLRFVGLWRKRQMPAGELSFGQQKLLELAMALMSRPRLLLLDEPTAGINPTLINALVERLQRINTELNVTLLVIEHNMRVIMGLAQHIYCLSHGKLLADGPPETIRDDRRVLDAYLGAR